MLVLLELEFCRGTNSGHRLPLGSRLWQFLRVKGNGVKMKLGAGEEDR